MTVPYVNTPIPTFYSRYSQRSQHELQVLLTKSRQQAAASAEILHHAARLAQLVKDDEPWIAHYATADGNDSHNNERVAGMPSGGGNGSNPSLKPPPSSLKNAGTTSTSTDDTAGHSNTNHVVPWIYLKDASAKLPQQQLHHKGSRTSVGPPPDVESNRVRELQRNRDNRRRLEKPESKTTLGKWDKPFKTKGGRRRRIVRDQDQAAAPPEPPTSGYTQFVFLQTTKIRHDRGVHAEHSQAAVLPHISRMWRFQLSVDEQTYYHDMATAISAEYKQQVLEFRATGTFRPSEQFVKLGDGAGPWVHLHPHDRKTELEQEVAQYKTVVFPPRPPEQDAEYAQRMQESKERRKAKLRAQAAQRQAQKRAIQDARLQAELNQNRSGTGVSSGTFATTKAPPSTSTEDGAQTTPTTPNDDTSPGAGV